MFLFPQYGYTDSIHMMSNFVKNAVNFCKNIPCSLALLLLVITILRIPTFFDPYWYGDEGIYLVIGTALNRGALMYTDIVDHKTPIIYQLARVESQLAFRLLLYCWMIVTTTAFFYIAQKYFKSQKAVWLAGALFVTFTTLPWMEGHIANGELFVMGFVLVGLWILTQSKYFAGLLQKKYFSSYIFNKKEFWTFGLCGVLLGLGILTKVPALFDAVAIISISYFLVLNYGFTSFLNLKTIWPALKKVTMPTIILIAGILLPILFSILYYYLVGSGKDYLEFGLLYNFKYAGSWDLGLTNPLLVFFFTLKGKVVFLIVAFLLISFCKSLLLPKYQMLFGWFALTFIASLLSNRPYPHYFLQSIPPLALIAAAGLTELWRLFKHGTHILHSSIKIVAAISSVVLFTATLLIMHVGFYPVEQYYATFLKYATGGMSQQAYYATFNYLMTENYEVAPILMSEKPDKIFIWGTNPMLYALTKTRPVGRFTVAFHIEDLHVQDETMDNLRKTPPLYVVVMKDQPTELPGLNTFLERGYMPIKFTDHMIIWRKLANKRV